jgi:hypothetical protein
MRQIEEKGKIYRKNLGKISGKERRVDEDK